MSTESFDTPEWADAARGMMEDAIEMGAFGVPADVAGWHLGDELTRRGLMARVVTKSGVDYRPTQAGREWLAAQSAVKGGE